MQGSQLGGQEKQRGQDREEQIEWEGDGAQKPVAAQRALQQRDHAVNRRRPRQPDQPFLDPERAPLDLHDSALPVDRRHGRRRRTAAKRPFRRDDRPVRSRKVASGGS
jgi:hypothetical protein